MERMRLSTSADAKIRALRATIMPGTVMPLKDLPTGEIADIAAELHATRTRYLDVCADIDSLQREIG